MLKFTLKVKSQSASGSAAGKSADEIQASLIWTAEVIHNGLSKVIAILNGGPEIEVARAYTESIPI